MAHVHSIPPIPGVDDLYSLLAFLSDKGACERRFMEMEKLRDEINGLVELVGKAHEIEPLQIKAETDRLAAAAELEQGRAKVRAMRDEADASIGARMAEFDAARAKAEAILAERRQELNDQSKFIAVDREKITQAEDALKNAERTRAAYEAKRIEAEALRAQYEAKLMAIRKAAGE